MIAGCSGSPRIGTFSSNGHLYLLYTYDTDVTVPEGPKVSRLTRITVTPENAVENPQQPETVLLGTSPQQYCPLDNAVDCIPSEGPWHTIGSVRVDPTDGTLWVGSGDATQQHLYPERAFRVQDPQSLAGKILHVDREGRGLPGHPFCPSDGDLTHNCTKVAALGFRNPFRFTVSDQGVVVGDVGSIYTEEINLLTPGGNYGWPCLEGLNGSTGGTPASPSRSRRPCSATATGISRAGSTPRSPPARASRAGRGRSTYQDNIFFADYAAAWMRRIVNENGSWRDYSFDDEAGSVVDLQQRANGNLLYLDIWDWVYGEDPAGTLKEIAYAPDGRRPIARFSVSERHGALPLETTFDAGASSDPDGGSLTFAWDFDDDGVTDDTGRQAAHTYTEAGPVLARLTVSNGQDSATRAVSLWPGNTPPQAQITAPVDGARAPHGSRVYAQATASDAEDGELRGCQLRWHVRYLHDGHIHPYGSFCDRQSSFIAENNGHGDHGHYQLVLVARDNAGASVERAVDIYPGSGDVHEEDGHDHGAETDDHGTRLEEHLPQRALPSGAPSPAPSTPATPRRAKKRLKVRGLPLSGACPRRRSRRVRVLVTPPHGTKLRSVSLMIGRGLRSKATGSRSRRRISLGRQPAGRHTVKVIARTTGSETLRYIKRFSSCIKKPGRKRP